jgi:hypothetical protein
MRDEGTLEDWRLRTGRWAGEISMSLVAVRGSFAAGEIEVVFECVSG